MGINTIACCVPFDQPFILLELNSLSRPSYKFVVLRECVLCPPSEGRLILPSQFLTFSTRVTGHVRAETRQIALRLPQRFMDGLPINARKLSADFNTPTWPENPLSKTGHSVLGFGKIIRFCASTSHSRLTVRNSPIHTLTSMNRLSGYPGLLRGSND
jgi:hypothetical protein